MNLLKKIRQQPEGTRKIILWAIVVIVSAILIIFWAFNLKQKIITFQKEDFLKKINLSEFQEKIKGLPELEINISEEDKNKLEEEIKKLEEEIKKLEEQEKNNGEQ